MTSAIVFKFSVAGLAGFLVVLASACGGGGPDVPACRAETPTPPPTLSPAPSITLKVGSYEGTGSPQCISGLGFQPIVVIIKGNLGEFTVWRSGSMEGDSTADFASGKPNFEGGITSIEPDAFSIGNHAAVNAEGTIYHWVAFADSPDIKVGSYTGDGADRRSISGVGFEPAVVFLKADGLGVAVWRSIAHPDRIASFFHLQDDPANLIRAFQPDGFQIGSELFVNDGSGPTYHYVAFRDAPGRLKTGSYLGDGSDDRSITDVGFQPDYVWIKRSSSESSAVHRPSSVSSDETLQFNVLPNLANEILALEPDGFRVGSEPSVNFDGDNYYYVAWKAGP